MGRTGGSTGGNTGGMEGGGIGMSSCSWASGMGTSSTISSSFSKKTYEKLERIVKIMMKSWQQCKSHEILYDKRGYALITFGQSKGLSLD